MTDSQEKKNALTVHGGSQFAIKPFKKPLSTWLMENAPDVGNKLILEDVHARDEREKTPLHHAAENDYVRAARLIKRGANVHAIDNDKETPLHAAAESNSVEVAALLIKYSANVNACSDWRGTPLHYTAYGESLETTALLIKHGADVNKTNDYGLTPLHWIG